MAESELAARLEEVQINNGRKETPLTQLMNAIKDGDIEKCKTIVIQLNKRMINCKVRLNNGYAIPPLIWAVINHQYEIVTFLISAGADIHRMGYYQVDGITYSVNALLKSIGNGDQRMIDLLLEHGASGQIGLPGTKTTEEEGGSIRYLRTIYPLNVGLNRGDITIYKSLLKHANMTLEFGELKHTCLCYAVYHFVEREKGLNYSYIREVIQHGGRLCSGQGGDGRYHEEQLCAYFQKLFRAAITVHISDNGSKYFQSSYVYSVGLKLVASTDYAHRSSPVYRSFKYYLQALEKERSLQLSRIFDSTVTGFTLPVVTDEDEGSVDALNWFLNYTKTPSSLQHIARVTIRNCITPLSVQKCKHLPLPDKLVSYIALDDAVTFTS